MPDELSFDDWLDRDAARLANLLEQQRQVEEQLRWVDDRHNELSRRCEAIEEAITDVRRGGSDDSHG